MNKVLVLNASYEPISFVSIKRAVVLLLKEKAEVIEASLERRLRAERATFPYPLVIRLVTYVPIPRFFNLPLSRRSLLSRDSYMCQYCGAADKPLTMDHVVPKSKGGKTEWTNVVAACVACNRKKGNKLPAEIKMFPHNAPTKPAYIAVVLLGQAKGNETWARYINP